MVGMVNIKDYEFDLPAGLIAQAPVQPRDTSKLLVYDTKTNGIIFDQFFNLDRYLPEKSFLVMNETKVLPSRVVLYKSTGGKVKTLFLVNEQSEIPNHIRIMVDRKISTGEDLFFNKQDKIKIVSQDRQLFTVLLSFSRTRLFELLLKYGSMPIPPYIKHTPLHEKELRESYQTIFAHKDGSSAAPTASLHFTDGVFKKLKAKNISYYFLTLHVGMGTFASIGEQNIKDKKLHYEWYEVPKETDRLIDKSEKEGKELVAVGTTVVRTLEALTKSKHKTLVGKTDLFIYPPYEFKMVDHLITNFHLPESSLMMLVDAFLEYKGAKRRLIDIYKIAINEKCRFFSFGDVMLII